jgi:hypothetical protein
VRDFFIVFTQSKQQVIMATGRRSDPGRIKNETTDLQRDVAAKGGPATGTGNPQNRQAPSPADTNVNTRQGAGKMNNEDIDMNNEDIDAPTEESQTKSRSGNRVPGSNH